MRAEAMRQEDHAELIASENYASPLVMAVQDSVFTNKYAEGYPGRRYYSGCEHVDVAERLALERVKALFDCDYANVQPHAGAQANAAVFLALTRPGDTVMGMNLAQGGHLTHGNPSTSGRHYHIVPYGLDPETGLIDYDEMERIALRTRPRMLIGGFSAYSRHKDWARMRASPTRSARCSGWTWRTWPDWSLRACIPARCRTRTWSPAPRTRRCAAARRHHPGPGQDEDFCRKLDSAVFPGIQGGPLMHVIAAKAVAFKEALAPAFRTTSARWWPTRAPWRP